MPAYFASSHSYYIAAPCLWDLCWLLEILAANELPALNDPRDVSGRIYAGSDAKRAEALSKVRTAAWRARRALAPTSPLTPARRVPGPRSALQWPVSRPVVMRPTGEPERDALSPVSRVTDHLRLTRGKRHRIPAGRPPSPSRGLLRPVARRHAYTGPGQSSPSMSCQPGQTATDRPHVASVAGGVRQPAPQKTLGFRKEPARVVRVGLHVHPGSTGGRQPARIEDRPSEHLAWTAQ